MYPHYKDTYTHNAIFLSMYLYTKSGNNGHQVAHVKNLLKLFWWAPKCSFSPSLFRRSASFIDLNVLNIDAANIFCFACLLSYNLRFFDMETK